MNYNPQNRKPAEKLPGDPWWQFGPDTLMLIGGLILISAGCFSPLDLFDFRLWPWWYFLCLVIVLAFSVRWFLLYRTLVNDDFDPQSLEEAQWFCWLSSTTTAVLALLVVSHQIGLMRYMYFTLNYTFGYGGFSFWALLIFAVIIGVIGLLAALTWKWISSIPID